jgi:transposase-like protein
MPKKKRRRIYTEDERRAHIEKAFDGRSIDGYSKSTGINTSTLYVWRKAYSPRARHGGAMVKRDKARHIQPRTRLLIEIAAGLDGKPINEWLESAAMNRIRRKP